MKILYLLILTTFFLNFLECLDNSQQSDTGVNFDSRNRSMYNMARNNPSKLGMTGVMVTMFLFGFLIFYVPVPGRGRRV